MIYHIVTGDIAATPLREAIAAEPVLAGEEEGQKFSERRSAFWQQVINNEKNPVVVDDTERLSQVSLELSKNEEDKVWVWIAPWPADICTYLWTLKYLGAYAGRFFVVNIAGLPFLDENGKIFYPRSIGDILPKELIKAKRLARLVNPAELEVDGEEWNRLVKENTGIRIHDGGKKIVSKPETHYDNPLLSFCSQQYQKASKIVSQSLSKFNIPTGDLYLGWRLRQLAAQEKLNLQGDVTRQLKDFDVKIPSGLLEFGEEPVEENTAAN
jgi:hypothetical protein